jgi:transposase
MMPRAASISSTMRRPSGNRKYSQIAWLMISAGKRWPAYGERAGVAIPLGYPAHSATASPSARNLTVPLFVFRGRRGGLIKVLWHDGQGMCLFAKRLDQGRFIWPTPADGTVTITTAQLGYLLEGIDWRAPQRTWRPQAAG